MSGFPGHRTCSTPRAPPGLPPSRYLRSPAVAQYSRRPGPQHCALGVEYASRYGSASWAGRDVGAKVSGAALTAASRAVGVVAHLRRLPSMALTASGPPGAGKDMAAIALCFDTCLLPSSWRLVDLSSSSGAIKVATARADRGVAVTLAARCTAPVWREAGSGTGDEHMYRTTPLDETSATRRCFDVSEELEWSYDHR